MASVNQVYSALKDLVNKDQRGFVTPAVFNSFASVAQTNLFNKLFSDAALNKRIRNSQSDAGRDKSRVKQASEDLSIFSKKSTIALTSGVGDKPTDLGRVISIITTDATAKNVEIVYDEEKIDYILRSTLSAPSASYPVALVSSNIQVFPTTLSSVLMRYYKVPQGIVPTSGVKSSIQPRFGYTVVAGQEQYSAANSIDFELPEYYFAELVIEMAKLIGVNLRDKDVYAFSVNEEKNA
tara:strand:- start:4259 stop:4972 length:714 start_codon:yes stop_codon:yes gene_type:complete